MKTAVSIPDALFRRAERLARRARMSRSELYAKALAQYLEQHNRERLTDQANELADRVDTALSPGHRRHVNTLLGGLEW